MAEQDVMLCQEEEWKDSRCKLHFHALPLDTYCLGSIDKLCVCMSVSYLCMSFKTIGRTVQTQTISFDDNSHQLL